MVNEEMHGTRIRGGGIEELAAEQLEVGVVTVVGAGEIPGLADLRVDQDYALLSVVKKIDAGIHIGKPKPTWFFRINPAQDQAGALRLHKESSDSFYALRPGVDFGISDFGKNFLIFTAINREGEVFLLPTKLPDESGKLDPCSHSMREAAELAKEKWVRLAFNPGRKNYDIFVAEDPLGEPTWPEGDINKRVQVAFKGRFISDKDHPIVRGLRGCR